MIGKRLVLGIVLLLLAAPQLLAQQPETVDTQAEGVGGRPQDVNIRMTGAPRAISIAPSMTSVCRGSQACVTRLDFKWVGPRDPDADPSERIVVEYQDGLYWKKGALGDEPTPAVNSAEECFSFPGGANPFVLEHGPDNGQSLTFRQDNKACRDKVAFFFEIRCQNAENKNCGGVEPLDPGTMVDNGKRP